MSGPLAALPTGFARALVAWQRQHGRHGLPWQGTRDPYRVWLSEIMLQQTQVSTVLAYYERFLERFADVSALAAAPLDEVMGLWSGLGYYSRARHLHRCAQVVVERHAGVFPSSWALLRELPGIGPSTAAAIAAFCHGERISIVDGNVRRVLSRLLAFDGDLSQAGPQRVLWDLAQGLLPEAPSHEDMVAYTQGLMDLGAGVCTRTRPDCAACPVAGLCRARASGSQTQFPVKSRRVARRHESWWLLVWRVRDPDGDRFWLERRADKGIWAGLHAVPVFGEPEQAAQALGQTGGVLQELPPFNHALTHRELRLHPWLIDVTAQWPTPTGAGQWMRAEQLEAVGMPAPVRQLLRQLPD